MSRFNYLLFILLVSVIGTVFLYQINYSVGLSSDMVFDEFERLLNIRIISFYQTNKRYPNSNDEIKKILDLSPINNSSSGYYRFSGGGKLSPARFEYCVDTILGEKNICYLYFGCEFLPDYGKRGFLKKK